MKRPKVADMNDIERLRFRLGQARRGARRELKDLVGVKLENLSPSEQECCKRYTAQFQTILALTKPAHIAAANYTTLRDLLQRVASKPREQH
jgi:hypothetical protein